MSETKPHPTDNLFYTVVDPSVTFRDRPLPAMTSVLHRICDNDQTKFEEGIRLIELFMEAAYDLGKQDALNLPGLTPSEQPGT